MLFFLFKISNQDVKLSLSNSVSGTPVCRGKYQGTARIVTRLSDAKLIQQGDVLITISTDIGWSPYFPLLGGVVTELGQYYYFFSLLTIYRKTKMAFSLASCIICSIALYANMIIGNW